MVPMLTAAAAQTHEVPEAFCEYRTLQVDAQTGDVRFIAPEKIGPQDCSESGAAQAELDPAWRQKLPARVRWRQRPDALGLCQSSHAEFGQPVHALPDQGCVFVQARTACTIVTAQAISHALLANAVRSCVP